MLRRRVSFRTWQLVLFGTVQYQIELRNNHADVQNSLDKLNFGLDDVVRLTRICFVRLPSLLFTFPRYWLSFTIPYTFPWTCLNFFYQTSFWIYFFKFALSGFQKALFNKFISLIKQCIRVVNVPSSSQVVEFYTLRKE